LREGGLSINLFAKWLKDQSTNWIAKKKKENHRKLSVMEWTSRARKKEEVSILKKTSGLSRKQFRARTASSQDLCKFRKKRDARENPERGD